MFSILILVGLFGLVGCVDEKELTGKYTVVAFVVNGEDVLSSLDAMGIREKMYIEFYEGGTYKMDIGFAGAEGITEGTFVVGDGVVELTDTKGKKIEARVNGKKISIGESYYEVTFEKE